MSASLPTPVQASPRGLSYAAELRQLHAWIEARLGLNFERHLDSFRTRVLAFCGSRKLTPAQLLEKLEREDSSLVDDVADELSTNHTAWFREPEAFEVFRRVILPSFDHGLSLRLWSAASSSGEEAYSIAFTLRDELGREAADRARILGTDISPRQVARAERARYPSFLVPKDPELRARFEKADGGDLRVPPSVAKMCVFRRLNLTKTQWPFTRRFHVVFLRNVLYYFEPSMQRRVVEACYDATEPGGWLVTSFTEPMLDFETRWTRFSPGIFRKVAP